MFCKLKSPPCQDNCMTISRLLGCEIDSSVEMVSCHSFKTMRYDVLFKNKPRLRRILPSECHSLSKSLRRAILCLGERST